MSDVEVLVDNPLFSILQMLMITGRRVGGLADLGLMKEMEKELTKVREDLDCAISKSSNMATQPAEREIL